MCFDPILQHSTVAGSSQAEEVEGPGSGPWVLVIWALVNSVRSSKPAEVGSKQKADLFLFTDEAHTSELKAQKQQRAIGEIHKSLKL